MTVLEPQLYALWAAKQTAKGTPASTATKRVIQVAGDFTSNRDDGSENFSDLSRFGDSTDYVNTITGEGNPGIEATPDTLAYICWLYFGQETVTGSADPYTHVTTPSTNGGFWSTWWKRVGSNVIERAKFNDCRMGALQIEGSTGAKIVRATPTMISLDPGERFATDPTPAMPTEDPFLYTEGTGSFTINGAVFAGQSQFTANWDEGRGPYYGDDVVPLDLIEGTPSINIAATVLVDTAGFAEFNRQIYGTATPSAGAKPTHFLPAMGSYSFALIKKDASGPLVPAREFDLLIPGVKWTPSLAIPANPDGGAVELSLGGQMRRSGSSAESTITIKNGVAAYTV